MRAVLITMLLALASCGSSEPAEPDNITLSPEALLPRSTPTSLAGVDFTKPVRAFGTEPYWSLDITPELLRFEDYAAEDDKPVDWAPRAPKVAGNRAVLETRTPSGEAVTITFTGGNCLEVGGEGSALPLSVSVRIGTRTLTGCAGERLGPTPRPETDNAATDRP